MPDFLKKIVSSIKKFYFDNKDTINPVIILTVICLVVSLLLGLTNFITKNKILETELKNQNAAMTRLVPQAESFSEIDYSFELPAAINSFCVASGNVSGNETDIAYIITTSLKGYGGDVSVMTAISPDITVIGVEILNLSDETPGLGQNAGKSEFYSQFSGLKKDIILVKSSAKSENNEINAVTGATITSTAVKNAVNSALSAADEYRNFKASINIDTQNPETANTERIEEAAQ